MKNKRKVLSFILFLALMLSTWVSAYAESGSLPSAGTGSSAADKAHCLRSLGLYNGTSTADFTPDLGSALNREAGIVMLIRLMGLETEAKTMSNDETNLALSRFSDSSSISSWARNAVALATQRGLVSGMPGGTLSPGSSLSGNQYSTMILRVLGYEPPDFSAASQVLSRMQTPGSLSDVPTGSTALTRSDLVEISFGTLQLTQKDSSKRLIESLVESGAVSRSAAISSGLISNPPADEPSDTGSSSHHHHSSDNKTDTTPPTFTVNAESVNAGGDKVVLNFSKSMNTTYSALVIKTADDADGSGLSAINTAHASSVWSNGNKTLTVMLDEQSDLAFIPPEKYIGASISASAINGLFATTSAVYTASPVLGETTEPVLTSWDLDLSSGAITLKFNEVVSAGSITVGGITLANSSTSAIFHLTADSTFFESGATPTVKVLLNGDLSDVANICTSADVSYMVLDAVTIMDLAGNGNSAVTAPGIKVDSYTT